ncbi:MAG: RNA-binding cell elongation regulator Jag/EloR [Cetobacterium sp.]|uniref:RNA-binding cell elongation regulator Jag/EloR n=1 Tax=Cetobacterium sp. TaxID=2071632 RepID=UPI003F364583
MDNIIEIKAMNKEEAVKRALKILDGTPEQVVKIIEKKKSRSFLGFFNREGIYEIEINRNSDLSENQGIKEETNSTTNNNKNIKNTAVSEEFIVGKAQELLDRMGLDLKAEILRADEKNAVINLYGEDNGIIIGKKGKTLNSYEYLLNTLVKDIKIEVDVEGFKEKRNTTLRDLARKMAEKALKTNKPIKLNPMPPRERKIIHEVINKYPELDTYSEGRDPKRYIVIKRKK